MTFLLSLPLLQIHLTAVFATLLCVIIADSHALLWMLAKIKTLPEKRMHRLHIAVWIGIFFILSTGALMFSTYSDYLLGLTVFQTKILFVFVLLVNAVFIGKHIHIASGKAFADIPHNEKVILLTSGFISTTCWIGAFIAGKLIS